jgi:site-specific recombinase XerD
MENEITGYLRYVRLHVAATTLRRKEWELRAFGQWLARTSKVITEAKQSDVEGFLLSLDAQNQFRRSVCATIRDLFDFLKVPENPAAKIEFKRDDSLRLFHVPGKAAVEAIIAGLADDGDDLRIRDRLMVELAYGSGLRRDELRRVNIEDIDLEEHTVTVTGKGNKTRIVPVTAKAASAARSYLAHRHATRGPLLVSYAGRRLSCNGVYSIMRNRVGIRPHLLRHACAGHMLANGASIRVVQELLGHADLKATQIYTHLEKSELRQVVAARHPRAENLCQVSPRKGIL